MNKRPMAMKNIRTVILMIFFPLLTFAQISGTVTGTEDGKTTTLPGANIFWENTKVGTVADVNGKFSIEKPEGATVLIASFVGFNAVRKIVISRKGTINFTLSAAGSELNEVKVIGKVDATTVDLRSPQLTYKIDDKELRKAACCNLSESFETNASVDVAFTDAVTGTRQIEMLGLAGKYALIQRENIPFARGLNANTGLTYIPGPFVQSIQLTKGLSSVLNGYESITGQINVEFHKPETAPRLLLNVFGNQGARMELNAITAFDVSDKISSALLAHGSTVPFAQDMNDDGFADMPTSGQLNFTNRWHYKDKNGWEGQMGISAVQDNKKGGQMDFVNGENGDSLWGFNSRGRRVEFFGKNGYLFQDKPYRSFGFIYSLNYQDREALFGEKAYYGKQKGIYINSIFQDIIGNTQHTYRTGLSVQAENVEDRLTRKPLGSSDQQEEAVYDHERNEIVPGAYVEYTYEPDLKFTMVAGIRADYNSYFERVFVTPRLNLRYALSEHTTFRIGGGRGQRTPNVMAENLAILASSRGLNFEDVNPIMPEIAWNSGASVSQDIHIGQKEITLNVDAFYTWFENKVVTDLDSDPTMAYFMYQRGSRSLSLLGQIDYELFKNLDLRLAYKYLDSREQYLTAMNQSYLIPTHRAFANFGYATESNWKFDLTVNWFGKKRLPNTMLSPAQFQQPGFSEDFFTVNAQINKVFKNGIEVYAGVDNLLNFKQNDPIVNAENPYAPYFDSNFAWAPIFGRNIYVGLYYTLEKAE